MDLKTKRTFKGQLYEQFARLGKALAHGRRLELLDLLAQGEHTVEDLAREMAMSVASASQHLQVLRAARLVEVRREGLYAHYRLADERVFRLWQALRDLGEERLAEIDRVVQTFLRDRQTLEAISAQELRQRLREGNAVVLDVRPEAEYRAGHIPGARSLPIAELQARLRELPKSREIIAYCRGPYCVFADEAAALLKASGYRVRRFEEGFPDWRALGLPVEEGEEKAA
jgi:rhodanese-related sulfurtransferase/predicted transcriptional regulator